MARLKNLYLKSLDLLWIAALFGLPITTLPLFNALTGALVAPFSGIPVLIIGAAWFVPALFIQRLRLPYESRILAAFILIAVAATAGAYFIDMPTLKGLSMFRVELRAFLTLAIGLAFYLVFSTWPRNTDDLRRAFRWIHLGGLVMLLWSLTQIIFIFSHSFHYPAWVIWVQDFLVQRPEYVTLSDRVSGLAYEPSWFNHQLVILYLPLWLAATLQRQSAFRFRLLGLSLENLLLVFGLSAFGLSSPRIGLLSAMFILTFLFIRLNRSLVHWLQKVFFTWQPRLQGTRGLRSTLAVVLSLLLIATYAALAVTAVVLVSQRDWRLALLFKKPPSWAEIMGVLTLQEHPILILGTRLAFMERAIYWVTGWRTFGQYPWLGVGLGNSGFFFLKNVPALGWGSYEIRWVLERSAGLGNIKSLWVRLLAETGMVGFYTLVSWYSLMNRSARRLEKSQEPTLRWIALSAQLALVAWIGEGFSIDSFAMPYIWVILGLLSAALLISRQAQA